MSWGKVNPTQMFYYLQTGVILQKCVMLPLKRFELRSCWVMLHLRWVELQLGLKPLRRKLTHSVCSVWIKFVRMAYLVSIEVSLIETTKASVPL